MFEYLVYPAIGFLETLVGLEGAWHFTSDKTINPGKYKQIRLVLMST